MKSVRYLKAVLTVIAVCLVWICLRELVIVEPAHAAGTMDVNIVGIDLEGFPDNLPVTIERVGIATMRALPVKVE